MAWMMSRLPGASERVGERVSEWAGSGGGGGCLRQQRTWCDRTLRPTCDGRRLPTGSWRRSRRSTPRACSPAPGGGRGVGVSGCRGVGSESAVRTTSIERSERKTHGDVVVGDGEGISGLDEVRVVDPRVLEVVGHSGQQQRVALQVRDGPPRPEQLQEGRM